MKHSLIIALLMHCMAAFSQQPVPGGIGELKIGKTEAEIFNSLHITASDITNGSSETLEEFEKSVQNKIVRVQYQPSAELMQELKSVRWENCISGYADNIQRCGKLDQYFIPAYRFDTLTVTHFMLIFYNNKLVEIYYKAHDKNRANWQIQNYLVKAFPGYKSSSEDFDETNACGISPGEWSFTWSNNTSAIIAEWYYNSECCGNAHFLESEGFYIADKNYYMNQRKDICE